MNELKNIIVCPNCGTPHIRKNITPQEQAICAKCGKVLYKKDKHIELKIFLLVFSGLIFFIIGMFYPIVDINIIGYKESLRVVESSLFLFNEGYIFISLFVFFTIFLFPFICVVLYFTTTFLLLIKYKKKLIKKFLLIITILKDWCFLDIFFIGILVSLVKIFSYASIDFNIGFVAYIFFLSIMFYIVKFTGVETLWDLYENI